MVLRPVGPLSPGVYWFRRALVLLVVVTVVWAGYRWLGGGGDDGTDGTAAGATPTPTTSSAEPTAVATSTSPKPTKKPTKTATATTTLEECRDRDVTVTVATDAETYASGVQPQFTLTVANDSDAACLRDLGPAALELRVSSGGARIWSSDDCNPAGGNDPTTLEPGSPYRQTVTWSRQSSQPGCPTGEPAADPGQYQVIARNLEVISDPAVFTLE